MHLDVLDLRNFYYRSTLGRRAQSVIRGRVQQFWPKATDEFVAGFGFTVPLLRPYLSDARRIVALMPGPQGVMPWPQEGRNVSVLTEDRWWPLHHGEVDKLIVMHGLETSETPTDVLNEAARVLSPSGKVLFIVPNRAGLWARRDRTPFGYGRPYSPIQLEAQMKRHGFTTERTGSVLYQPPSHRKLWTKTAGAFEAIGAHLPFAAGGVLMVEASKQTYAPRRPGKPAPAKKALEALEGLARPEPKPV
ncbi:hypothetical protein [Algirhabdus cladophorae]|uniref:hypothetical protein n=1 Tax=Algirhabdus cladophorae TaxID=3377108 RepID=UPI003B84A6C9